MATKGNEIQVKATKRKTPAQVLKAQRNAAEAAIRLANLQRHQAYINRLRDTFGIIGGGDDYVLDTVGVLAIKAMQERIAARETLAQYVLDTRFYGGDFFRSLRGKPATYEKVCRFLLEGLVGDEVRKAA